MFLPCIVLILLTLTIGWAFKVRVLDSTVQKKEPYKKEGSLRPVFLVRPQKTSTSFPSPPLLRKRKQQETAIRKKVRNKEVLRGGGRETPKAISCQKLWFGGAFVNSCPGAQKEYDSYGGGEGGKEVSRPTDRIPRAATKRAPTDVAKGKRVQWTVALELHVGILGLSATCK